MLFRIALLLFLPLYSLTAQTPDSLRTVSFGIVDTIFVSGNTKTKEYVILDEMTIRPGGTATLEAIEYDRSRIYSLGLFNRVDMAYDSVGGSRILFVDVSERWYLIPVPLFGFRDGDPKRPFYGAGILHNNFAGRNQKLFASIVFGYNPSLSLFFSHPQIDRQNNLFMSGSLSYSRVRNKSEVASAVSGDFDEKHFDADVTFGKRFSLYESAGLRLGYQIVQVDQYRTGRTVSSDGTDAFISGTLSYSYDSRDLKEYAASGRFMSFYINKYGFGTSEVNFARIGGDMRGYAALPGDFTLASRIHGTVVSGGFIPTYNHTYFGYGERIRGYFKTVFEGENMLGTSVELRWPLLKARTIYFTAIPLPPEFSIWRIGISLAIFADAGTTWFRGEILSFRSFASGYGGGIHFLLPYSTVLRTEYAFNEYGKGQFIFDLRASL